MRLLWNHTARLYRATALRDGFGDAVEAWLPVGSAPTGPNARPDAAWSGRLADQGAGEEQAAARRWYLDASVGDVQERDVLDVTAGPEAPVRLRVLSVARPAAGIRAHHLEVLAEIWEGEI